MDLTLDDGQKASVVVDKATHRSNLNKFEVMMSDSMTKSLSIVSSSEVDVLGDDSVPPGSYYDLTREGSLTYPCIPYNAIYI